MQLSLSKFLVIQNCCTFHSNLLHFCLFKHQIVPDATIVFIHASILPPHVSFLKFGIHSLSHIDIVDFFSINYIWYSFLSMIICSKVHTLSSNLESFLTKRFSSPDAPPRELGSQKLNLWLQHCITLKLNMYVYVNDVHSNFLPLLGLHLDRQYTIPTQLHPYIYRFLFSFLEKYEPRYPSCSESTNTIW